MGFFADDFAFPAFLDFLTAGLPPPPPDGAETPSPPLGTGGSATGVGVILRIFALFVSATYTFPVMSTATPLG